MNFSFSLIIGGVIGAIAQMIINKDIPGGTIGNIIIGCIGSILGGWLLGSWGWTIGGFAVFPAIIGAVIIVTIYDLIF